MSFFFDQVLFSLIVRLSCLASLFVRSLVARFRHREMSSSSSATAAGPSAAEIERIEQDALSKTAPDEPLAMSGGPLLLEVSNEVRSRVVKKKLSADVIRRLDARTTGVSQVGRHLHSRAHQGAEHARRLGQSLRADRRLRAGGGGV